MVLSLSTTRGRKPVRSQYQNCLQLQSFTESVDLHALLSTCVWCVCVLRAHSESVASSSTEADDVRKGLQKIFTSRFLSSVFLLSLLRPLFLSRAHGSTQRTAPHVVTTRAVEGAVRSRCIITGSRPNKTCTWKKRGEVPGQAGDAGVC